MNQYLFTCRTLLFIISVEFEAIKYVKQQKCCFYSFHLQNIWYVDLTGLLYPNFYRFIIPATDWKCVLIVAKNTTSKVLGHFAGAFYSVFPSKVIHVIHLLPIIAKAANFHRFHFTCIHKVCVTSIKCCFADGKKLNQYEY